MSRSGYRWTVVTLLAAAACSGGKDKDTDTARVATAPAPGAAAATAAACAPDNGGLTLPQGFCASVFADSIGHGRHLVVGPNGDVYVNTWSGRYYSDEGQGRTGGFVVALRDTNKDGRADLIRRFGGNAAGNGGGTGIALHDGYLYADAGPRIVRYKLLEGDSMPTGNGEVVVDGFPTEGDHPQHNFVIAQDGALYANMGSATNSCQRRNRTENSPGIDPCTELRTRAGIWRFDASKTGQRFGAEQRWATGIRNAVGLAFGPDGALYATQHGRDQLFENWKPKYTSEQGQELPSEELMKVDQGADFGWPYCYYDPKQQKLVDAPEYGGDGTKATRCGQARAPVAVFPAHWAPNDVVFYNGTQFPAQYRGGAFVAFHGSWNRAPGPQGGYQVAFVKPGASGTTQQYETFANGFAGGNLDPKGAAYRPAGVGVGPDGALYVTDDVKGRVWRIVYKGS